MLRGGDRRPRRRGHRLGGGLVAAGLPCARVVNPSCEQRLACRRVPFDRIEGLPQLGHVAERHRVGIQRSDEFTQLIAQCLRAPHEEIVANGCDNYVTRRAGVLSALGPPAARRERHIVAAMTHQRVQIPRRHRDHLITLH